jgi:hypothetical protein
MHADCLPGATVTVRVNGTPLTEHATENGDLSATTFVEAVAGAEFDVALNWDNNFAYRNAADRIRFTVYVDGEWVQTPIVSTHAVFASESIVAGPEETRNGMTTIKRLTFAQHASSRHHNRHMLRYELTPIAADNRADDSTMKKQIKVTLQRCRETGPKGVTNWNCDFKGVGDHAVPEKALKGRSISSHTK